MPITPCDDPNCTCRDPEMRLFTEQVLRKDATKTDYIVIPLVAGVLARCILSDDSDDSIDPEGIAATRRHAESVMAIADRGRTESWEKDHHAYGIVASFVFCNWASSLSWGSVSYQRTTLGLTFGAKSDEVMSAAIRYLGATPRPTLTESVILTISVSAGGLRRKGEMPLLGKAGRRLRVVLAERIRRQGLTSWPKILVAAVDDWTLGAVQRLALHNALAADSAIHYAADLIENWQQAAQDATATFVERVAGDDSHGARQDDGSLDPGQEDSAGSDQAAAAEELINAAVVEITSLRDERAAVQRERDTVVQRDARLQSRVESLEHQLADERERRHVVERENAALRAERDRYAERIAAEDALLPESAPPPVNAFAGRRVLFFTGVEAADTRNAFARGFWELGAAHVDTYWTDRTRGPDAFPPDAIIAIDVSLMPHTASNAVLEKAKRAGAWYYSGRHGVTTMARATAAAWTKHRARS